MVLDDFIEDSTRQQLLDFLLGPAAGPVADEQPQQGEQQNGQQQQQPVTLNGTADATPPHGSPQQPAGPLLPSQSAHWERRTSDMAGAAATWGVQQRVLQELARGRLPALQEVHARLCRLYPECDIAHLPSDAIQLAQQGPQQGDVVQEPKQQEQDVQQQQEQDVQQQQEQDVQQQQEQDVQQQQEQDVQQQQEQDVQRPPAKRSKADSGAAPASTCAATGSSAAAAAADGGAGGGTQPAVDCACFVANAAVTGDSFRCPGWQACLWGHAAQGADVGRSIRCA